MRGPAWLTPPADPNALVPHLWSRTARKVDGELHVGGLAVPELVADQVDPSVRIAVQVLKGMRAAPAQGDSILAAVHLSATQFESLMRRIAADSVMSADYRRLTR